MTANPFFTPSTLPYGLPPFAAISFEHYAEAFERGMAEQRAEIEAIARNPEPPTFTNTIVAVERTGELLDRVSHAFFTVTSADTDDRIEALQAELAPQLAAHSDAIMLDRDLFARVDALERARQDGSLDADPTFAGGPDGTDGYLLQRTHLAHVRAGAALPADDRQRLTVINGRLAALSAEFGRRLLADTNASALHLLDEAELAGLDPDRIAGARAAAAARGLDGYLLTLVLPTHQPALEALTGRDVRRRLLAASEARGSRGNEHDTGATLLELVRLRAERARLLGFAHHVDYVLADRMAGTEAAVRDVLDQVVPPALDMARREADDLTAALRDDLGDPDATLEASDWAFYTERLRQQRYAVDTAALKPYFALDAVVTDGVFAAATALYAITFTERPDLAGYHPGCRVFEVTDADGSPLGLFVGDYFTRDSKKGGAWMNFLVSPSGLLDRRAVVANNLNLTPPPDGQPALLSLDEVTTAFHEFGHALHGLFSAARYPSQAGTSVARDFVEYPSQVNEMWQTWPEVLRGYARHHETGEPLDPAVADAVRDAAAFNAGFETVAFCAAAWLDLCWHRLTVEEAAAVTSVPEFERAALAELGLDLPALPPRYRSAYFSHVFAGGYSAGYYSYLWSEVLDADTVEWFRDRGGLVRAAGDVFREQLLSRGGSVPEPAQVAAVLGRPARIEPLLRRRGLLPKPSATAAPRPGDTPGP